MCYLRGLLGFAVSELGFVVSALGSAASELGSAASALGAVLLKAKNHFLKAFQMPFKNKCPLKNKPRRLILNDFGPRWLQGPFRRLECESTSPAMDRASRSEEGQAPEMEDRVPGRRGGRASTKPRCPCKSGWPDVVWASTNMCYLCGLIWASQFPN